MGVVAAHPVVTEVAKIPGRLGPLFTVFRRPAGEPRGCVLVIPPFAEEMNKCRPMLTALSAKLLARDFATCVFDLSGTGDSAGDFSDATVDGWLADVAQVVGCCASRYEQVSGVLAVRLGAALSIVAAMQGIFGRLDRTVLWQPSFDGHNFLRQFLRLRSAAAMMAGQRDETVGLLRNRLLEGEPLKVAGYTISPELGRALDVLRTPTVLPAEFGQVSLFEVAQSATAMLSPSSRAVIADSQSAGIAIGGEIVVGEPFWTATEIVQVESLITRTLDAFAAP
jgi:exosortase A-associated hydrolase 2